jgi:hypothetical protein
MMIDNIKGRQLFYSYSQQEFMNLTVNLIIACFQHHRMNALDVFLQVNKRI